MAGWFAKLMQQGDAHSTRAIAGAAAPRRGDAQRKPDARDARYDALVQMLRDREAEDRAAREKRQRGYRQSLESDAVDASSASGACSPARLYQFRTTVPCRATADARSLLDELRQQVAGGTVTFPRPASGRQAVMVTPAGGIEPRQIGWIEHCIQSDPKLCNVRDQGLSVETDGGAMLVLRFRYSPSAARMFASDAGGATDGTTCAGFAEIRGALDLRPADKCPSPRLLWVTRAEAETMNALQSRDYEAFYVRFKRELLAATWSSLSGMLSNAPRTLWHRGTHYTVVREPDAGSARIYQRTLDDCGHAVDLGSNRSYDAAPATDILLLHLDTDILADVADIYFTVESLGSTDGYFLKDELFAIIRRFWASSRSLTSPCGSELAAVLRMARGALPMPVQSSLLKQDWTNLRQSLVDRYGEGGRKAPRLAGRDLHRRRTGASRWPFATFTPGDVNVGLRFVYRQERTPRGAQDGEAVASSPDEVADPVVDAASEELKRPLDADGCINLGMQRLAASSGDALRDRYDVGHGLLTHPTEIQNVVIVAEKLPAPAEIDIAWVRRHDWILGKVLLDESFRDALDTIGHEARNAQVDRRLDARRTRFYEHLRANILHYQRAIWQQEDPQRRSMRYRQSKVKVPLEWRFELESSATLTIEELSARLDATEVNGQFAAYTGGREADLDQLIDPAGPVAYYGNLAVHRMRPEFASGELFSMLHFFKSPYLRPNRETGEPELGDPAQVETSEDRVPENAGPPAIEHSDSAIAPADTLDGWRIVLESGRAIELVHAVGRREAESEWVVLRESDRAMARMLGGRAHDPKEGRVTSIRSNQSPTQGIVAGRVPGATAEWALAARADTDPQLAPVAGAGTGRVREWALLAREDQDGKPGLVAGGASPNADERMIIPPNGKVFVLRPDVAGREPSIPVDVVLPRLDMKRMSMLRAGRARADAVEWVMRTRDDRSPKLTQHAGIGAADAHDRVILADANDWLRPSLVAEER